MDYALRAILQIKFDVKTAPNQSHTCVWCVTPRPMLVDFNLRMHVHACTYIISSTVDFTLYTTAITSVCCCFFFFLIRIFAFRKLLLSNLYRDIYYSLSLGMDIILTYIYIIHSHTHTRTHTHTSARHTHAREIIPSFLSFPIVIVNILLPPVILDVKKNKA